MYVRTYIYTYIQKSGENRNSKVAKPEIGTIPFWDCGTGEILVNFWGCLCGVWGFDLHTLMYVCMYVWYIVR